MSTGKKKRGFLGRSLDDLEAIHAALAKAFSETAAPIMDLVAAQTRDPFRILVGTILSARTKDAVTAEAVKRLFAVAPNLETLEQLSLERIQELIYPVGFYKAKAQHLLDLPKVLREKYAGKIPHTVEELIELPGVGRKTANLVVALGFGLPAICVDTHVHRINNRLGIVRTESPLETEMALRKGLPQKLWIPWNSIFVSFGQTRCKPIGPKCEGCPIAQLCPDLATRQATPKKKPAPKGGKTKKPLTKKKGSAI